MRGIFFEEDAAGRVVDHLRRGGWESSVRAERLAGEDDDEDVQWVVQTDAPAITFELLVDQHEGWLDSYDPSVPAPAPLDLPTAPRRIKRP